MGSQGLPVGHFNFHLWKAPGRKTPTRTYEYLKPSSLGQTLDLLSEPCHRATVIAGRTDLKIQWKKKLVSPEALVSLRSVPELRFTNVNNGLKIGATTTFGKPPGVIDAMAHFMQNVGAHPGRSPATTTPRSPRA